MHSTIYEFSKHPISESRRATIDSLPEWFFQTVADSATDTDEISRAVQIRCLEQHFGDLCIRDGDQLHFVCSVFPKQLSLFYGGSTGFGKGVLRYVQRHHTSPCFPCGAQQRHGKLRRPLRLLRL